MTWAYNPNIQMNIRAFALNEEMTNDVRENHVRLSFPGKSLVEMVFPAYIELFRDEKGVFHYCRFIKATCLGPA